MKVRRTKRLIQVAVITVLAGSILAPSVSSATYLGETSLAGMTLSLDNYVSQTGDTKDILADMGIETTTEVVNGRSVAGLSLDNQTEGETGTTEAATEETTEATTEEVTETTTEAPVSEFADVGISIADNYVNIRKKPDTESKILGKLYKGAAATILETEGDWVKIKSGKVTGYIKSEYLAIGFDAEELVDKYGTKIAKVNTTTLKVRESKGTDAIVLTLIPLDEEYEVVKVSDGWVKIMVDETTKGWVSADYVDIRVEFEHAISIEEEEEKLRREKEAEEALKKQQEAEAKKKAEAEAKKNNSNKNNSSSSNKNNSSSSNKNNSSSGNKNNSSSSSGNKDNSSSSSNPSYDASTGSAIASFAQKFVGNPYVYGGTSLTNGADCSGFVQSVYSNFGISLPRTSRSQAGAGSSVSVSNVKPGDLIFYASNGTVNHVAIYIGDGKVCHASSPRTGIKISNMYYRTPYCARRVVS